MSEKVINILKHEDGNETVIVEFGLGKVGIGLLSESESQRNMVVHLQELKEAKDVGAFLTAEEREENFKNTANPLEVALAFPDVKAIDNFIETLKIYRQKVFYPNARRRGERSRTLRDCQEDKHVSWIHPARRSRHRC